MDLSLPMGELELIQQAIRHLEGESKRSSSPRGERSTSSSNSQRHPLSLMEMFGASALGLGSSSSSSQEQDDPLQIVPYEGEALSTTLVDFLQEQTKIRVYIEGSLNFGHQTNTINILYTLRSIGYTGAFDIVVAEAEMIKSLTHMFPWLAADSEVTLTARDDFYRYSEPLPLCLTGGFDNNDNERLLLPPLEMGVNCFLALQPYRFERLSHDSRSRVYLMPTHALNGRHDDDSQLTVIDLCKRNRAFLEMSYLPPYVPRTFAECQRLLQGSTQGWDAVIDESEMSETERKQARRPRIVHSQLLLFSVLFSGEYHVAAAYGLKGNFSLKTDYSADILFRYSTALSLCPSKRKRSVIVVFHDTINDVLLKRKLAVEGYWGVAVATMPDFATKAQVREFLRAQLNEPGNDILVLVVGTAPQLLFNFCFQHGDLPCIFEGEGSVPVAFLRGAPFLYMKGPGAKTDETFYPSLNGAYPKLSASLQRMSSCLFDTALTDLQCQTYLFKFFKMSFDTDSLLCRYFRRVAAYYAQPAHNRLFVALELAIAKLKELKEQEDDSSS
ncbi:hypothetical protein LY474_28955 [Myxococcus stipitatus]|uniref:hypothetical protein n=1 Tax=Myxococcus stipitatus TaxID=83455 RepID=UPI001F3BE579|nr:hypothetical protein [Myxococcus stipitatus]MCE9671842.1 hypothetical protein [Myxococcus stipitatus]